MEAGEILLKRGLIRRDQLEEARRAQTNGARVDQVAVALGMVSEDESLKAIGAEVGIDYIDLSEIDVDPSLIADFPLRMIHRHALFPVSRNNGTLVVATSDPFDLYPLDELSATTGLTVVPDDRRSFSTGDEPRKTDLGATRPELFPRLLSILQRDGQQVQDHHCQAHHL